MMTSSSASSLSVEDQILEELARLSNDPVDFVRFAFPWGEPGTELEEMIGPEAWQMQVLVEVRDGLLTADQAIKLATASGHGVGKSALVAWLILWAFSTFEDTKGVVTANTENQLKTKTWAELGKWFHLFIGRDFFNLTATALYSSARERTWRVDMVAWSERNTEAFAGMHNQGKRILMVFDEASNIPDLIWEVTEGALTDADTQIIWAVFGNPTRNSGRFRDCFDRDDSDWLPHRVDSRSVSFTNKSQIRKWIQYYGEDSDFVRVRVLGTFPRQGTNEFISRELVDQAVGREVYVDMYDPLVIGVDVARFGDDSSVIYIRKGRDATAPPIQLKGLDTMQLALRVQEEYARTRADAVFVDGGGVGGGVVDRLRMLRVPVYEVRLGASPDQAGVGTETGMVFANKRAEVWGAMREWLKTGSIADDRDLRTQLVAPTYGYNAQNAIQLERKVDMRKRGAPSPDVADGLALTFAMPITPSRVAGREGSPKLNHIEHEYDPFSRAALAA